MDNPLISVIVPIYKVEEYLDRCVESIINQTYKNLEIILVDDGSPDNCSQMCDCWAEKDNRIKVIHKENGGVSSARNKGIELAKGEYICFVDSDDFIESIYIATLLKVKNSYTDYDNIWCGMLTVDGNNDFNVLQRVVYSENELVSFSSRNKIMTLHEKWLDAAPYCKLYSKKIIDEHRLRFLEDLSLGEDLIFNFIYLDCTNGKVIILNNTNYNYVMCNAEALTKKHHKDLEKKYIFVFQTMFNYLVKWNCDFEQFQIYYNSCFFIYDFILRNTFHPQSKIKNKYKYNKQIMKSKDFKEAFNRSNCFIHPMYRFAYKHNSYRLIRLFDRLTKIKKNLIKIFMAKNSRE